LHRVNLDPIKGFALAQDQFRNKWLSNAIDRMNRLRPGEKTL
jgi:hypothetical protein